MRRASLCLLLLLCAGQAAADDEPARKPRTRQEAAAAALAAFTSQDTDALKALARKEAPDPWEVADELCFLGHHDAAAAFAAADVRPDMTRLPAYVAAQRKRAADRKTREMYDRANKALRARKFEDVLEATAQRPTPPDAVVPILIATTRGLALQGQGKFAQSATLLREAADAAAKLGWFFRAGGSYYDSGVSAYLGADWKASLSAWRAGLAIYREVGDRQSEGQTLGNMAIVHNKRREYEQASLLLAQALAVAEDRKDGAEVARLRVSLGEAQRRLGRYALAQKTLDAALSAARKLAVRDVEAAALSILGLLHDRWGNYDQALRHLEDALAVAEARGDESAIATIVGNIGGIHDARGDWSRALSVYEDALARKVTGKNRHGAAITLENIAGVYGNIGDWDRALGYYERARKILEDLDNPLGLAGLLGNVANIHKQRGDLELALGLHRKALALKEVINDPADIARTVGNIGGILAEQEKTAEALAHFHRALALQTRIGDAAGEAVTSYNIARVRAQAGEREQVLAQHEQALQLAREAGATRATVLNLWGRARIELALGRAREAVATSREAVGELPLLVRGLGSEEGARARERWIEGYDIGIRAAAALGSARETAFFMEVARAGTLLETLDVREGVQSALVSDAVRREERAARAKEQHARDQLVAARLKGVRAETRKRRRALTEAMSARADIVARIERSAKAGAALAYPTPASLEALMASLRTHDVMVLFAVTPPDAFACVIEGASARVVDLGSSEAIRDAIQALSVDEAERPVSGVARLRQLLTTPLKLAPPRRRVLVSPGGVLGRVPFALLFPKREVVYVPSGTTYTSLRAGPALRGGGVLALGDPDYGATKGTWHGALQALPKSRLEVEAIGTVKLLGKQATEPALRKAIAQQKRWRAIHLACHGLVNEEKPLFSSLALAADAQSDGVLSVLDILHMRFPADLVALSACETARGRAYRAEGIIGMTRAFMFAGARRVLCSLWEVDDDATQALMAKFYELWHPRDATRKPLGAAAALKQAQNFVRSHEDWKHPYFWAAWTLWGLPD